MLQVCAKLFIVGPYFERWIPVIALAASTMTHLVCLSELRMGFESVVIHTDLHSPFRTILARFTLKIPCCLYFSSSFRY